MNRLQRLIQLNAKTSAVVNLAYGPDDEPERGPGIGAAVGAGTVATGGLYAAGARSMGLTGAQAAEKLGQNLGSIGRGGVKDAASAVRQGAGVTGDAIKGLLAKLKGGAVKTAAHGLSSRMERLVELRAKTDKVIQFKETERKEKYHPGFAAGVVTGAYGVPLAAKARIGAAKAGAKKGKAALEAIGRVGMRRIG